MLELFDVIWLFDRSTRPPKNKMQVCLSHELGWFVRINTRDTPRPAVPISKADNPWLEHDSHVECALLEFDEFEIDEAIAEGNRYCGRLNDNVKEAVIGHLLAARYIREDDKDVLRRLLE